MKIVDLKARQILDSRANPTVEVDLYLEDGSMGRAAVPSGASTGVHEALELRDGDSTRYHGKGVLKAVENVNNTLKDELAKNSFDSQESLDKFMNELDGTDNKSNLGANAILGVSMAFAVASARSQSIPVYKYIKNIYGGTPSLPVPMFNIMNGGKHANWSTDVQEFMIIPRAKDTWAERVRVGAEIFISLEKLLKSKGLSTNVGNEGGFAPNFSSNKEALDFVMMAIEKAGYKPGEEIGLALDVAASEFYNAEEEVYELKTEDRKLSAEEWMGNLLDWSKNYPMISIEDAFGEDDWTHWHKLNQELKNTDVEQLVGDDLLVTNVSRIQRAIEEDSCNSLLVKLNQIGSLTETLAAMKMSEDAGWRNVVSHRSGETEDVFISHLVVGTGAGQLKSGAPSRGERTAKFNEIIRIEEIINN